MVSVFSYSNFKDFLKDELEQRVLRNQKYSLRAFARDINISFSRLSEILSSNDGISSATAHKVATALKLMDTEKEYFILLVLSQHGRTEYIRNKSLTAIKNFKIKKKLTNVKDDNFGILSKWYYISIIEMITLKQPIGINEISTILKISVGEVELALLRLNEMGYLSKAESGKWVKSNNFIKIESKTSSKLIKEYHRNFLQRANSLGLSQAIENRKYLSSVFGVQKEKIKEARVELEMFNQAFLEKFASEDHADQVYVFGLQLYRLGED